MKRLLKRWAINSISMLPIALFVHYNCRPSISGWLLFLVAMAWFSNWDRLSETL